MSTNTKKLILIRHGETDVNALNKTHVYKDAKVGLNNLGVEQMKRVADKLKNLMPLALYCSEEKRTRHSAAIISKRLKTSYQVLDDILDRNWGNLSGKSWEEIKNMLDKMNLNARRKFVPNGGESWKDFEQRLIKSLNFVLSQSNQSVAIVTHGGVITVLMPYLLNGPKVEALRNRFDTGSITIFECKDNKHFCLISKNDLSHLQ